MPKKTFELAEKAGAELIVQVKKNQKDLCRQIGHGCQREKAISSFHEETTKSHGRLERRTYEVFETERMLIKWREDWPYIRRVIRVRREREVLKPGGKASVEESYYVSNSLEDDASFYGSGIRGHWGIENQSNYIRDVVFHEDQGIRRVQPGAFAKIISIAYNSIRASGSKNFKNSVEMSMMSFDHMISNLALF